MPDSPPASTEPHAWLNGRWIALSQAAVSVFDGGFVQGVTVAEQLRTFGGRLFRLEQHLSRLARSLEIIGVDPGYSLAELAGISNDLAARNYALLDHADDVNLTIFVTPGPNPAYAAYAGHRGPTVCIHAQPLAFGHWADKYRTGDSLVVSDIRHVPAECWPTELKCRSRMHFYLADQQARRMEAGARALLLDERGFVTEASTANILVYRAAEGLVSPRKEQILPGVTVAVIEELAGQLGIPLVHRDLPVDEVASAEEVLLCSTSPCLWSVTRLNGRPIGNGRPGPISARLRAAWNEMVGIDIEAQALRLAGRT